MKVHLIDGTFELFRAYFGAPPRATADGLEVGAVRGLARSMLALLGERGVTHVAIAFDHVIESFRNDLYPGYKTGEGIDPEAVRAVRPGRGRVPRARRRDLADDRVRVPTTRSRRPRRASPRIARRAGRDLLARQGSRAVRARHARRVPRPDRGERRSTRTACARSSASGPASIPDWLALVGDSADGFPGVPRWGAKSAAAVLGEYEHLEAIPDDPRAWSVKVRGADALAARLREHRDDSLLFRRLATLRADVPLQESLDDLRWRGRGAQCSQRIDGSDPRSVAANPRRRARRSTLSR